jgi:chemotaxis protein histidine kinase CheA
MNERVRELGGQLTVETSPGKGTTIAVSLPEAVAASHAPPVTARAAGAAVVEAVEAAPPAGEAGPPAVAETQEVR